MDDQQNQYNPPQPGQAINPGQPQAPQNPAPQQQPMQQPQNPAAPQQPAPVPQPPQQPMYQQPVQQQQYQQPVYQQPQQQIQQAPRNGPSIKLLAAIAGGFLLLALIITVVASSLGGSSLSLTPVDAEGLDFKVSVPEGWVSNTIDITSIDSVSATPSDAPLGDETSVNITRTLSLADGALTRFVKQTESSIDNLSDESYQSLFNISISNLKSDSYGTDESPAYLTTYDFTNSQSGIAYSAVTYYIYESANSSVNATFIYSDQYAELGSSASDILATYAPRENSNTSEAE